MLKVGMGACCCCWCNGLRDNDTWGSMQFVEQRHDVIVRIGDVVQSAAKSTMVVGMAIHTDGENRFWDALSLISQSLLSPKPLVDSMIRSIQASCSASSMAA